MGGCDDVVPTKSVAETITAGNDLQVNEDIFGIFPAVDKAFPIHIAGSSNSKRRKEPTSTTADESTVGNVALNHNRCSNSFNYTNFGLANCGATENAAGSYVELLQGFMRNCDSQNIMQGNNNIMDPGAVGAIAGTLCDASRYGPAGVNDSSRADYTVRPGAVGAVMTDRVGCTAGVNGYESAGAVMPNAVGVAARYGSASAGFTVMPIEVSAATIVTEAGAACNGTSMAGYTVTPGTVGTVSTNTVRCASNVTSASPISIANSSQNHPIMENSLFTLEEDR